MPFDTKLGSLRAPRQPQEVQADGLPKEDDSNLILLPLSAALTEFKSFQVYFKSFQVYFNSISIASTEDDGIPRTPVVTAEGTLSLSTDLYSGTRSGDSSLLSSWGWSP